MRELPAVVVIFFELDWTDPDWNEKKLECAGKVRHDKVSKRRWWPK